MNAENYRILVIDDNPAIHDDVRKILQPEDKEIAKIRAIEAELLGKLDSGVEDLPNFHIDSAHQGEEGYNLVCDAIKAGKPYALAFVDIRMPPGWDGVETISHIWLVDKDIQIVICTAYSDYSWSDTIKKLGQSDRLLILKKPFDNVEIRQLACALTKKWSLTQQVKKQLSDLEEKVDMRTAELRATLDSTTDGILAVGIDGKILNFNQKFIDIWGIAEKLLKTGSEADAQKNIAEQIRHAEIYLAKVKELDIDVKTIFFEELKCKNGRVIECYSQPQKIEDRFEGRIWCYRDITQRKELELQLAFQATHDILTGLPNRSLLLDHLHLAIAHAKRTKLFIGILFFDLDRLKLINDSMGHNAGDKLLQEIGRRLSSHVRESDTVARLGGDEFVMIITSLEKEEHVLPIACVCLDAISKPIKIDDKELRITASVGISIYPKDGEDITTLLRNADIAMYRAKEAASNLPQFYTKEMNTRAQERLTLENNLRIALEKNEFILYYQPLIDLTNGSIFGVEALLRWQHPKLGIIPPLEFIPLAEEIGLILPISEWVLRAACVQQMTWQKLGLPALRMAINISAQQLKQKDLVEVIQKIITETKVNPKHLEFELTESILIHNRESINNKLKAIKDMGIDLVIDDFGTGYSSLSYLKLFPIDKIKIDQSFVHYISPDPEDTAIIAAIMSVAKTLKLRVLAEGVETKEQLEFLRASHCNEAQGYYFSRPLTTEGITELLRSGKQNKP